MGQDSTNNVDETYSQPRLSEGIQVSRDGKQIGKASQSLEDSFTPAGKGQSSSHLTDGCYSLEPESRSWTPTTQVCNPCYVLAV